MSKVDFDPEGYLYIASSAALDKKIAKVSRNRIRPPILKIGRTWRPVEQRIIELCGNHTDFSRKKNWHISPYAGQIDWTPRCIVRVSDRAAAEDLIKEEYGSYNIKNKYKAVREYLGDDLNRVELFSISFMPVKDSPYAMSFVSFSRFDDEDVKFNSRKLRSILDIGKSYLEIIAQIGRDLPTDEEVLDRESS